MRFDPPLTGGRLIRRYKRFLADVETPQGVLTIHCPNTGSMRACGGPGARVWFSRSGNTRRKYPHTWELVETEAGDLACINTQRANQLVAEALAAGVLPVGMHRPSVQAEVAVPAERSRIDFLITQGDARLWIEVKSVTLREADGCGYFPDAVSLRGQRHLELLMERIAGGDRAMLLFCVLNSGIGEVRPADHIDPRYGELLRAARDAGVELRALGGTVTPAELSLSRPLPVRLD